MKGQSLDRIIWISSLILLGISLFFPAYSIPHDYFGAMGITCFVFGFFGLILGGIYLTWLANAFLITAIFTNKKYPLLSAIMGGVGLIIALTFLRGGVVLLNSAGHKSYIYGIGPAYWLWILSIAGFITSGILRHRKKD